MQEKNVIFAENAIENIFAGKLIKFNKFFPDRQSEYKLIGCRLETSPRKQFNVKTRSLEDENGSYRGGIYFGDVRRRRSKNSNSLLFPIKWSENQVIDSICEAFANKILSDVGEQKYVGKTADGMFITLWLDEAGKVIDAMPTRTQAPMRKGRKKVCKVCGQPKHYICPEHHPRKKTGLNKIYVRARYHLRKFYYEVFRAIGLAE